jgi:hypothetical protein
MSEVSGLIELLLVIAAQLRQQTAEWMLQNDTPLGLAAAACWPLSLDMLLFSKPSTFWLKSPLPVTSDVAAAWDCGSSVPCWAVSPTGHRGEERALHHALR